MKLHCEACGCDWTDKRGWTVADNMPCPDCAQDRLFDAMVEIKRLKLLLSENETHTND